MRTELEQQKRNALTVARTAIRLRHRLEADNELNARLDALAAAIDEAIREGRTWVLNPATLVVE